MLLNPSAEDPNERVYKIEKGTFSCPAFNCCIFEQNIYTLEPSKVNVRTFQVNACS